MEKATTELKDRVEILKEALLMESFTSFFLAGLLGIDNPNDSKSFGNTGSALSFSQKIHLLMDLGALNADLRAKYQTFMEIRNQFMHNAAAADYEQALNFADKFKWILGKYPQEGTLPNSQKAELAVKALCLELRIATRDIIQKYKEKVNADFEREATEISQEALQFGIKEAADLLNDYVEKAIAKGPTIKTASLKDLGTQISKLIYNRTIKKFGELTNKANSDKTKE